MSKENRNRRELNTYVGQSGRDSEYRNSRYSWWDDITNNYTKRIFKSLESKERSSTQRCNLESSSQQYKSERNVYHPYLQRHQDILNPRGNDRSADKYLRRTFSPTPTKRPSRTALRTLTDKTQNRTTNRADDSRSNRAASITPPKTKTKKLKVGILKVRDTIKERN